AATHDLYAKVQEAKAAGDDEKAAGLQKQLDAQLADRAAPKTPPISSLEKLKEFENLSPRDEERPGDYMEKLTGHIKEKGFKDFANIPTEEHPVTIGYNQATGRAMILDGHHRMEAAKAAGLKDI